MDEWKSARRSGPVQMLRIHTNQRRKKNINKGSKDQTGSYSAMTRLAMLLKKGIRFSTKIKLYKSLVLSILLYGCESWTLTADLERGTQAFEINATGGCLGHNKENLKLMNMHGNRSISSPELLLSTVASYHGSAMSAVIIRCRKS